MRETVFGWQIPTVSNRGLDEDRTLVAPQMRQGNPEQAISVTKPMSFGRTVQDQQLLAQGQILRHQYEPGHKQTAD
jgi:hypothetical protein